MCVFCPHPLDIEKLFEDKRSTFDKAHLRYNESGHNIVKIIIEIII